MNSVTLCLVLATCATCTLSQLLAATQAPSCTQHGHTYAVGESFQPSPCEHCFCSPSGQVACAITDCFFTMCVDAVHDPKHCCPTCPNGANCKHTDGTIIKKGTTYSPDANTVCKCPENHFGFSSQMAICAHTVA